MKKGIVTFGRFNPPTIGHEKMIKTMLEYPDYEPLLFTSIKGKERDNPIDFSSKVEILQKAFPFVRPVVSTKIHDVFSMLLWLKENKYSDVILLCGSDKFPRYSKLMTDYIEQTKFEKTLTINHIREGSYISATTVRKKIREQDSTFLDMLPETIRYDATVIDLIIKSTLATI